MPITTVSTPNMKRQKDSFILHKYLLKSTSGNFSFGIHHLYDSSEKHGFMFISWAVYNPLKFEFSLCWSHEKPDTIRNSQIRERAFKGLRRVKLAAADDQKSFYDHFTRPVKALYNIDAIITILWIATEFKDFYLKGKIRILWGHIASPQVIIYSSQRIKKR